MCFVKKFVVNCYNCTLLVIFPCNMSCHDYCHLLQILVVGFAYSIVS
jgi:hypothetical protein